MVVIMATESIPHLCATSVVEDIQNHDEVIGLKLLYAHRACIFIVLIGEVVLQGDNEGHPATKNPAIKDLLSRFNDACACPARGYTIDDLDKRLDPIWQEAEDLVEVAAFHRITLISKEHGYETAVTDTAGSMTHVLAEYLFPKAFNLQIIPEYGGFDAILRTDLPPPCPFATETNVNLQPELLRVKPEDARVVQQYRMHVLKVQVGMRQFCCKLNNNGAQNSFLRELKILQQIRKVSSHDVINVPQIRGVVVVADGVIGFLMDLIETKYPDLLALLRRRHDVPHQLRQRWAEQMSSTLKRLHALGVVWGDAKASNVLIDDNSDAWLIDFGGGFTRGWVDEALYDSQMGDLQGLQNTLLDVFGRR